MLLDRGLLRPSAPRWTRQIRDALLEASASMSYEPWSVLSTLDEAKHRPALEASIGRCSAQDTDSNEREAASNRRGVLPEDS